VTRTFLFVLSAACVSSCGVPAAERSTASVQPTYDKASGKLTELAYDANGNGRPDTWTEMDGTRPLRSRIDMNEDGKIDRWEHYALDGHLVKVGFSRSDNGKADAWAFSGTDGKIQRIEMSSLGDEHRIDRWEYFDASRSGPDGQGALVRAEEDTTGDGKPDKWETYEEGAIRTVAFDEDGNGRPDRRLTYATAGLLTIESQPDASGRFTRRVAAR
jgi:hypothetical protein